MISSNNSFAPNLVMTCLKKVFCQEQKHGKTPKTRNDLLNNKQSATKSTLSTYKNKRKSFRKLLETTLVNISRA